MSDEHEFFKNDEVAEISTSDDFSSVTQEEQVKLLNLLLSKAVEPLEYHRSLLFPGILLAARYRLTPEMARGPLKSEALAVALERVGMASAVLYLRPVGLTEAADENGRIDPKKLSTESQLMLSGEHDRMTGVYEDLVDLFRNVEKLYVAEQMHRGNLTMTDIADAIERATGERPELPGDVQTPGETDGEGWKNA